MLDINIEPASWCECGNGYTTLPYISSQDVAGISSDVTCQTEITYLCYPTLSQ